MMKRILAVVTFLAFLVGCATMPVNSRADDDKELQKNLNLVLDAYKAAPLADDTIAKMDGFTARWKDTSKLESARIMYLKGEALYEGKKYAPAYDTFKKLSDDFSSTAFADSAMYKLGEADYNMGKYSEAIDDWTRFRFKYTNSLFIMEAVYGISLSYLNLTDYKKADRELSDFLAKYPYYTKDDNVRFIGGLIDFYLKRYEDAAAKLKTLKSDASYYYLAHSLLKQNKYPEAAEAFKNVGEGADAKKSKYYESAMYNKAEAFYKSFNYPVAAADYLNFINTFPTSSLAPYAIYKRGAALFKDKKYEAAAAVYKQVMDGTGDKKVKAFAQYLIAECFLQLKKYDQALAAYEKLMAAYPDIYDVYASGLVKAGWCYVTQGKYEKAQGVLRSFVEKFVTHENLPLGYYLLGTADYKLKQYGPAVEAYKYIIDKVGFSGLTDAAMLMIELCYYDQQQYSLLINEAAMTLGTLSDKYQAPNPKVRARAYYYLGKSYIKSGMYGLAAKSFQQIVDVYYDSDIVTESRANLAWCYYELENYRGARTMAKDVVSSALANDQVKKACDILIAHSYFSEKEYDKASAKYGEFAYAHEKDKDFEPTAEALFQQGRVFETQEFYNDAIKSWQILASRYPKSKRAAEALYKMSDIYFKAQQFEKSLAGFQEILDKYPKTDTAEDAMLSIAEVYYNSDQEAKAVDAYKRFMTKYPDSNKVTSVEEGMQRATYKKAEKTNDPKALLEYYNKYPDSNLAVNALYKAAETYYTENKYKESIDAFNKLIEQFPNDTMAVNAHYYVGACYEGLQQMAEAVAAYKAFIKNYPKHELASDVTFRLATAAYMSKSYPDAIFYYERIIQQYPGTEYETNAMYNLALAYGESGKQDEAIRVYKLFAKTFPKDPKSNDIALQIAGMYLEAKRYKDALAEYAALAVNGANDAIKTEAMYRAGDIYTTLENPEMAIQTLTQLFKAQPKDSIFRVSGLINLATICEGKSDWKGAVAAYEEVAVSGGQKEYVTAAAARKEEIKSAYPDLFKAPAKNTDDKKEEKSK